MLLKLGGRKMKKVLAFTLLFIVCSFTGGCSGGDTAGDAPTAWVENTSREPERLDYVVTALATDHEINANWLTVFWKMTVTVTSLEL